jgi:hypothetical protein
MSQHLGLPGGGTRLPRRCGISFLNRLRRRASVLPVSTAIEMAGPAKDWTQVFSAADREFFHREAGDLLIRLGYETSDQWVGSTSQPPMREPSMPIARVNPARPAYRRPDAIAS